MRKAALRTLIVVFALLGLAVPTGASATQQPGSERDAERRRVQARLDSLVPVLLETGERASAAVRSRTTARAASVEVELDTIHVGPLRIAVSPGGAERARPHFERAWAYYAPMLGGVAPAALSSRTFVYHEGFFPARLNLSADAYPVITRPFMRANAKDAAVRRAVGRLLTVSLPWQQSLWIGASEIGLRPDLEPVYRQLATGLSATLARCRSGDLESCWVAMGATRSPDPLDDLRRWYTEEQRRAIGQRRTLGRQRSIDACVAGGIRSCDEELLRLAAYLTPLDDYARASLLGLALELGGDGAFHRFAQPAAAPTEQLDFEEVIARTAGADADVVMAAWLGRVTRSRPDSPSVGDQARVGTLLWILLFVGFATRSTRWRLG